MQVRRGQLEVFLVEAFEHVGQLVAPLFHLVVLGVEEALLATLAHAALEQAAHLLVHRVACALQVRLCGVHEAAGPLKSWLERRVDTLEQLLAHSDTVGQHPCSGVGRLQLARCSWVPVRSIR